MINHKNMDFEKPKTPPAGKLPEIDWMEHARVKGIDIRPYEERRASFYDERYVKAYEQLLGKAVADLSYEELVFIIQYKASTDETFRDSIDEELYPFGKVGEKFFGGDAPLNNVDLHNRELLDSLREEREVE